MLFVEASTFDHSPRFVAKHRQCSEVSEGHFKDTTFHFESGLEFRRIVF